MFEIGTGEGGSCRMWKSYFGPMARIVTIDIRKLKHFEELQIFVRTGDQSDSKFLNDLLEEFGPPDIVLDDGSHQMKHIRASFDVLFPRMSKSGTYLVEDLNTAYWPQSGGGLRHPDSFIERAKTLVDEMNAIYTQGKLSPGPFGEYTVSVSFYQMIVAIEKAPFLNRKMVRLPRPL